MAFQEIPSNGCRYTAVKVLCYAITVPFNYWPTATKLTSFVGNVRGVLGVEFDKIPPMEAETLQ